MSKMVECLVQTIRDTARDFDGGLASIENMEEVAHAFLAALREPTVEMLDASYDGNEGALFHWQSMIDAALK